MGVPASNALSVALSCLCQLTAVLCLFGASSEEHMSPVRAGRLFCLRRRIHVDMALERPIFTDQATALQENMEVDVNRHNIPRTCAVIRAATSTSDSSFINMKVNNPGSSACQQLDIPGRKPTSSAGRRTYLCCEVRLKDVCDLHPLEVRQQVYAWLVSSSFAITLGKHDPQLISNPILRESCAEITIEPVVPGELGFLTTGGHSPLILPAGAQSSSLEVSPVVLALVDVSVQVVAYRLHQRAAEAGLAGNNEEDVDIPSYQRWHLPHEELHGLWDTLHFDSDTKKNLLQYATTAMLFSDRHVDSKLITWNRVLLLHGPPGTGKSSLCKALAHKLSVRLSTRYSSGQLIEVNAHSLLSRWFSESGKLVVKLFTAVKEMLEDNRRFVCILVDEVESVSATRSVASSGADPSDALRVVNVLLTQLDTLRSYPNALVLTTSNLTEKVDPAFLDRADLKQYIPNPSRQCRYEILKECLEELMMNELLKPEVALYPFEIALQAADKHQNLPENDDLARRAASQLLQTVDCCEGFSGRTLRKLPFLAFGPFTAQFQTAYDERDIHTQTSVPSTLHYLERLHATVQAERVGHGFATTGSQNQIHSNGGTSHFNT